MPYCSNGRVEGDGSRPLQLWIDTQWLLQCTMAATMYCNMALYDGCYSMALYDGFYNMAKTTRRTMKAATI